MLLEHTQLPFWAWAGSQVGAVEAGKPPAADPLVEPLVGSQVTQYSPVLDGTWPYSYRRGLEYA